MKKSTFFAGLLASLLLVGCGKVDEPSKPSNDSTKPSEEIKPSTPAEVKVTGVTIDGEEKLTKYQPTEGTVELTAKVAPENATNKKVVWSSSDATIATVDANGKVTLLKGGEVTITAKSEADDTKKDEVKIKSLVKPTGFKVSIDYKEVKDNKFTLEVGDQKKPYVTAKNEFGANKGKWSSSDATVVKAESWGGLTPLKVGTATLTFTSDNDATVKEVFTVTVKAPAPVVQVKGTYDFAQFKNGEITKTYTIDNNGEKLIISDMVKAYQDNNGSDKHSLKLGSSSAAGKATITLPEGYTKAKLVVAEWSGDASVVTINGTATEITKNHKDAEWQTIEVAIPADRKLKIEGTGANVKKTRVLIDKIVLVA